MRNNQGQGMGGAFAAVMGIIMVVIVLAVGISFYMVMRASTEGLPNPGDQRSAYSIPPRAVCKGMIIECPNSDGKVCDLVTGGDYKNYVEPGEDFEFPFRLEGDAGKYQIQFFEEMFLGVESLKDGTGKDYGGPVLRGTGEYVEITIPSNGIDLKFTGTAGTGLWDETSAHIRQKALCYGSTRSYIAIIGPKNSNNFCTIAFMYKAIVEMPDWKVESITVTTTGTAATGGSYHINGKIDQLASSRVECYKSYDYKWVYDGVTVKEGTKTHTSTNINTPYPQPDTIHMLISTIDDDCSHEMKLIVDPNGVEEESNENNNEKTYKWTGILGEKMCKAKRDIIAAHKTNTGPAVTEHHVVDCEVNEPCNWTAVITDSEDDDVEKAAIDIWEKYTRGDGSAGYKLLTNIKPQSLVETDTDGVYNATYSYTFDTANEYGLIWHMRDNPEGRLKAIAIPAGVDFTDYVGADKDGNYGITTRWPLGTTTPGRIYFDVS